jgi:FlaA1/EpsC-like NDP-sugar epimerase
LLRELLLLTVHVVAFVVAYVCAYCLRFDFPQAIPEIRRIFDTLPEIVTVKLVVFYFLGHYRGWLRYVTFTDLVALLRAASISSLLLAALLLFLPSFVGVPRSILLLDWALCILVLGALRCVWRLSHDGLQGIGRGSGKGSIAVLVGVSESTASLASQFVSGRHLPYRIIGILEFDASHRGTRLAGLPVLGSPADLAAIAKRQSIQDVLVISGSLPGREFRRLHDTCVGAGLEVKVLPALENLIHNGNAERLFHVRDVNINDLLRRDPVELDDQLIGKMLHGKTLMVTGAGGSIGSEICRQVSLFGPNQVVLVERAENNLFNIERELQASYPDLQFIACIADITDRRRLSDVFARYRPQVVFHAAAHKHVPMMENNCGEAVKNNVFGSRRMADMAHEFQVETFVLISTDKAVNPTSVMGASKQMAERYVYALAHSSPTKYVVVRFGNVLGSAGSVVPIFQQQIRHGGPVSITHPEMRRYFMTIPEASQLVIQAAVTGRDGEIIVLDMGEPVKIIDLARDLIRLSGLKPDDIEIEVTGMRPGEKMYEELNAADESTLPTSHPKLLVAYHSPCDLAEVRAELAGLRRAASTSEKEVRAALKRFVPEFANGTDESELAAEPHVETPITS